MKISVRQYAESLYSALDGREETAQKEILRKFVRLLAEHRALSKAPAIIQAFSEVWEREKGELSAAVATARKLDPASLQLIRGYLAEKSGTQKVELKEKISPDLLGGFILRYQDKIVDASVRRSLDALRERLVA